jgi:hypothetical protein
MNEIESKILNYLSHINSNGSFIATGAAEFILPGLTIKDFGELALPVTELQAKNLIKIAHKAPFGKGNQTILDETVRSAWEIDAQEVSFKNAQWNKWLNHLLDEIKGQLALEHQNITASFYKMLIYEKDDFFVWHKDSEKEKNMFATLVISLPSIHQGGELAVRFKNEEVVIDFSAFNNQYSFAYAAFYADCDHEVRPLISGYRVSLVYNLLQSSGTTKLSANEFVEQTTELAQILTQWEANFENEPKAILLGHQYTPTNFSSKNLKLDDLPQAQTLIKAAEKAGFFARLALVTHYQSGELEYEYKPRKKRRYYDDDDEEDLTDGEMGEVYEEYTQIENWADDGLPTLGSLTLKEENIITNKSLAEGNPIEKEAEGYTGNEGMTIEYWYHYGAVVLWHQKAHKTILSGLNLSDRLEWLNYYTRNLEADSQATHYIRALLNNLKNIPIENKWDFDKSDASGFADAWVILNDKEAFANEASSLVTLFDRISFESLLRLITCYPNDMIAPLFRMITNAKHIASSVHLVEFLGFLMDKNEQITFLKSQINQLPNYFANLNSYLCIPKDVYYHFSFTENHHKLAQRLIGGLLRLANYNISDVNWATSLSNVLTIDKNREFINDTLAKVLLEQGQYYQTPFFQKLLQICVEDLQTRTAVKPQPLPDWKRARPDIPFNKPVWDMLEPFLNSPTQFEFRYQKKEAERSMVESAIRNITIDLEMETVKKGSPHTLLIRKNQAAYKLALKNWEIDVELLEKLSKIG